MAGDSRSNKPHKGYHNYPGALFLTSVTDDDMRYLYYLPNSGGESIVTQLVTNQDTTFRNQLNEVFGVGAIQKPAAGYSAPANVAAAGAKYQEYQASR